MEGIHMAEQTKKAKEIIVVSPRGVAQWPKLTKPDTKFKADGEYSVTLIFDPNNSGDLAFIAGLRKAADEGFAAAQKEAGRKQLIQCPIKAGEEVNKDGSPTGRLRVVFAAKAGGERKDGSKWSFRPALFDSKGRVLPNDILIYGGSVLKVAFSIRHTAMKTGMFYTTFNLKSVMVLDLKSGVERSASEFGFTTEDEGYEYTSTGLSEDEPMGGVPAPVDVQAAAGVSGGDDF
jgi:hypothetical protein